MKDQKWIMNHLLEKKRKLAFVKQARKKTLIEYCKRRYVLKMTIALRFSCATYVRYVRQKWLTLPRHTPIQTVFTKPLLHYKEMSSLSFLTWRTRMYFLLYYIQLLSSLTKPNFTSKISPLRVWPTATPYIIKINKCAIQEWAWNVTIIYEQYAS